MLKTKSLQSSKELTGKLNEYRIYIFLLIITIFMAFAAPGFMTTANLTSMFKACLLPAVAGIGFTFVMIGGHFDLSIGAVINLGSILVIGEFNRFFKLFGGNKAGLGAVIGAWAIAMIIALIAGALVGAFNGWLVAHIKVHSFIVTIGTQTTVAGFVYWYCKGNSITAKDAGLANIIDKSFVNLPVLAIFSLRLVIVMVVIAIFEILLRKSKMGKSFYMVGSNNEAAWHAGISTKKYIMSAFIISGVTAALGGALFAISMNTAVPNYGERGISPLMLVLASTIIGGTAMTGGRGSVLQTAVAVLTIQAVFTGLICMGQQFDAQILSAGLLLGLVVLYEASSIYRQNLRKGQRPALMKEAEALKAAAKTVS